jgi:hypothetical protein
MNIGTGFNGIHTGDLDVITTNGTTTAIPSPLRVLHPVLSEEGSFLRHGKDYIYRLR